MRIAVSALPLLLITVAAHAQVAPERQVLQPTGSDRQFLEKMVPLNEFEIRLGQMAATRGGTPEIRDKGKKMSGNHLQLGGRLGTLAARMGVKPPTEPTAEQKASLDKLASLSGAAFDSAFVHEVDDAHAQARAILENEVQNGSHPELKSLAKENLAKLQPQASPR
jgi:putative membrane protein